MSEENYLFSEELRCRMAKFNDMDIRDAIRTPAFLNELLEHVGMTKDQQKELWEKVGRPDCFQENQE